LNFLLRCKHNDWGCGIFSWDEATAFTCTAEHQRAFITWCSCRDLFSQTISNGHTDDTDFKSLLPQTAADLSLTRGTLHQGRLQQVEDKVDVNNSTSITAPRRHAPPSARPERLPGVNIHCCEHTTIPTKTRLRTTWQTIFPGLKYKPLKGNLPPPDGAMLTTTDRHEVNRTSTYAAPIQGWQKEYYACKLQLRSPKTRTTSGGPENSFSNLPFQSLRSLTLHHTALDQNPAW
jgi:hypothetical protein